MYVPRKPIPSDRFEFARTATKQSGDLVPTPKGDGWSLMYAENVVLTIESSASCWTIYHWQRPRQLL